MVTVQARSGRAPRAAGARQVRPMRGSTSSLWFLREQARHAYAAGEEVFHQAGFEHTCGPKGPLLLRLPMVHCAESLHNFALLNSRREA